MIQEPMDVLPQFPIRRSDEQKKTFREAVAAYVSGLGFAANIESAKRGVNNIVIGDPEKARYLVTAHYDTPGDCFFPNLLLPANRGLFILYQTAIILAYFLVAGIPGNLAFAFTQDKRIAFGVWYLVYMFVVFLPRYGLANKNNYNDNTSGIISLLEILQTLPAQYRDRVCFVLFDQEEKGLVGSSAYKKIHATAVQNQIVLNLDCVGDGDIFLLTPTKSAREHVTEMKIAESICGAVDGKEFRMCQKTACDSSDHKNFPIGIGIKALHETKRGVLYCGRIHTRYDTVLDTKNIEILRKTLVELITNNL